MPHSNLFFDKHLLLVIALHLAVLTVSETEAGPSSANETSLPFDPAELNKYVDDILQESRSVFPEYNIDPMNLPDVERTFRHKVWFFSVNGGISTSKGILRGLTTVGRAGDITLTPKQDSKMSVLQGSLSASDLDASADVHAYVWFIKVNPTLKANAKHLKATLKLELPEDLSEEAPKATSFVVDEMRGFNIDVKNLGPLNWLAERIINWYLGPTKDFINENLAHRALEVINEELGKITSLKKK